MQLEALVVSAAAVPVAAMFTGVVRRLALSRGMVDVPNARSSHSSTTPRGGGAAIVLVFSGSLMLLAWLGIVDVRLCAALVGGGGAVALVGLADDRKSVSARLRLAVHFGAAAWAVAWLGGLSQLRFGGITADLGRAGEVLAILAIVWTLNLFNFMDGIDGIAGAEAAFICLAGGGLSLAAGGAAGAASAAFALAGSCLGFLAWNWPPAKIFMGDVGSGFIGFCIAVLALAAGQSRPESLWAWLTLGAAFFVDATLTLIRRAARGKRIYEAHREHAYQLLAQRWRSHLKVTAGVSLINMGWLLPLAALTVLLPRWAIAVVGVAFAPLVFLVLLLGSKAGRRARPQILRPPEL